MKLAKKNKKENSVEYWNEEQYKKWRNNASSVGTNFFLLYKKFENHLKEISSGALKLYLYYGFHAKNETGISWHSIETISGYFDVSEKTINNWNKELIGRGLIYRKSKDNTRNKTTYLLPLSMTLFDNIDISIIPTEEFRFVFGEPFKIYHLFQWRKDAGVKYDKPYHVAVIVLKKTFEDSRSQFTAIEMELNNETYNLNKEIDEKNVYEDILKFDSDLDLDLETKVSVQGIAVNTKFNLKTFKSIYELINELLDEATDIEQYTQVKLI